MAAWITDGTSDVPGKAPEDLLCHHEEWDEASGSAEGGGLW